MSTPFIPWWQSAYPSQDPPRMSLRDLWDAIFGRRETFYRVESDGSWCVVEEYEVGEFRHVSGDRYVVTPVRMTRRQFDALPEFEGF